MSRTQKTRDADAVRAAIRATMERRNLSLNRWAKLAQVSRGTIQAFLNGHTQSLTERVARQLADAAGESLSVMTGETPPSHIPPPEPAGEEDVQNLQMVVQILRGMAEEQKQADREIVRRLEEQNELFRRILAEGRRGENAPANDHGDDPDDDDLPKGQQVK